MQASARKAHEVCGSGDFGEPGGMDSTNLRKLLECYSLWNTGDELKYLQYREEGGLYFSTVGTAVLFHHRYEFV